MKSIIWQVALVAAFYGLLQVSWFLFGPGVTQAIAIVGIAAGVAGIVRNILRRRKRRQEGNS